MSSKKSKQPEQTVPVEAPNSLISNSRIKILDLVGEGEVKGFTVQSGSYGSDPLVSTYFDETPVRNLDGSYNYNVSGQGFRFGYTFGTTGQAPIESFEKVENILPLPQNTRLALFPNGGGSTKDLIVNFNTAMYPDADSVKITTRVPALLTQDDKGNTNGFELKYAIDISLNNQAFVQQEEVTIRGKCTSPYLRTTVYTLPKTNPSSNFYSWKVRIRRTTQNILSIKTQNELYVDNIAIISSSSFNYPNSVLVGMELSADQFGGIPTRAYLMDGLKVSLPDGYTPTAFNTNGTITAASYPPIWNGTFSATKQWTNNPAWIFYDLLTNPRYGLGSYIRSDWIDKWSLYEISQYCDELVNNGKGGTEPRFTCNAVIQDRQDAYQLILSLASVFRGMTYWGNGRIFANTTENKQPIYSFTNANVIDGVFTYSDTARNTRSTVIIVKWLDPENNYREAIEYVEDVEGIAKYGYIEKEIAAFACTSKGQAYRIGNWTLQTERLLTETVTFQTALEGLYLKPGDIFNVYDNYRNNKQQGGRIVGFNPARTDVFLDRPITLEAGITYAMSAVVPVYNLEASGDVSDSSQIPLIRRAQIENRVILTAPATVNAVSVNAAFSTGIYKGSIWLIGASGDNGSIFQRASMYTCLATSEPELGKVEILGLEYNTGINDAIEKEYTVVNNPVNSGDNSPINPPSGLKIYPITGLYSNNDFFFYLQIYWSGTDSTNLAHYKVSGQKFGGTYQLLGNPESTGQVFNTDVTGYHVATVAAVSYGGRVSSWITGGYEVPSNNPLGTTPPLSGLEISEDFDTNFVGIYPITPITGYTGYVGTTPTFRWRYKVDANKIDLPQYQFVSGLRLDILDPTTNISFVPNKYIISDPNVLDFEFTDQVWSQMESVSGIRRLFKAYVETIDSYGNIESGASLIVNNPPPRPPIYTSFYPTRGGLSYLINPNDLDLDISGIYLWYQEGESNPSFIPTKANKNFESTILGGFAPNQFTGAYEYYYSLIDTFGFTGCPIYGPFTGYTTLGVTGIRANTGRPADGLVTFWHTGNGLYATQSGKNIYISGDENLVLLTGVQTFIGRKLFSGITEFSGRSFFWNEVVISGDVLISGVSYFNNTGIFSGIAEFKNNVVLSGNVYLSRLNSGIPFVNTTGLLTSSNFQPTDFLTKTGNLSDVTSRTTSRANVNQGFIILQDGPTINTDCSTGNVFKVTLGGNRTLAAPTNLGTGATYIWNFVQDTAGNRELTFNSVFRFPQGSSKVLSTATGAIDIYTAMSDGINLYGVLAKDFQV
jgi:hypothetical protein